MFLCFFMKRLSFLAREWPVRDVDATAHRLHAGWCRGGDCHCHQHPHHHHLQVPGEGVPWGHAAAPPGWLSTVSATVQPAGVYCLCGSEKGKFFKVPGASAMSVTILYSFKMSAAQGLSTEWNAKKFSGLKEWAEHIHTVPCVHISSLIGLTWPCQTYQFKALGYVIFW